MNDKEAQLIWEALQKVDEAIPPQDDLDAQLNVHGDADIDHHNQHMMDQDLLQPIHQAANTATNGQATNINEWLILQIKEQGDNWVNWFIETVIVEERFRS